MNERSNDKTLHNAAASLPEGAVCLGQLVACHGLKGGFRLYTGDPRPDWGEQLERVWLALGPDHAPPKKVLAASIADFEPVKERISRIFFKEITTRTQAEAWLKAVLYANPQDLPELSEDEFRVADLEGLKVLSGDSDKAWGRVQSVMSSGGGQDFLQVEMPLSKKNALIPFKDSFIGEVNLEAGWLKVHQLDAFLEEENTPSASAEKNDSE